MGKSLSPNKNPHISARCDRNGTCNPKDFAIKGISGHFAAQLNCPLYTPFLISRRPRLNLFLMGPLSRRVLIGGISIIAMVGLAGCATAPMHPTEIDPAFRRTEVQYATREPRGTIVVDPANHYLYYVEGGGKALRYGVAVGGEGFGWSGVAKVHSKQEWPDWYPTGDILVRHPELRTGIKQLPSGEGIPGGPDSPMGARALYLWQGNKDTLYRIHGTNEPWKIGSNVSSGCIRMLNDDVVDLYERTPVGTKVVVLPSDVS
jgi:lipoprotein-anchoring transpeptidase ErfK/SrfK